MAASDGTPLRQLWQLLPRRHRRWLLDKATTALAPAIAVDSPAALPVCVAGLLSSTVGIGEGARLCVTALDRLGYRPIGADLSSRFQRLEIDGNAASVPSLPAGPGTIIMHLTGDTIAAGLAMLGRRGTAGKRIIGYWAWELPQIPARWRAGLAFVDEVWTPSRFAADAVRPFTSKPVRVVPHPVAIGKPGEPRRNRFRIAEDCFAVLTAFHMSACFARKNPLAAVAAFQKAFGRSAHALLIVKVSEGSSQPSLMARLRRAIGDAPNIRLYEELLAPDEMQDLAASVDAVLSLHRAEGFGLVMAQAMLAGTAVVATDWSGNLDFMDERSAEMIGHRLVPVVDPQGCYDPDGQVWAEPDISQAAAALARLAADPDRRRRITERARELVGDRLGIAAFQAAVGASLPASENH